MRMESVTLISMGVNKLMAQCYEPLIDGYQLDDDDNLTDLGSSQSFLTDRAKCDNENDEKKKQKCIAEAEDKAEIENKKVLDAKDITDQKEQEEQCILNASG